MSTEPAWPQGVDRIILDETDSTMSEARRRAADLAGPTWIMAHCQRAAHGRRGRPWSDLAGNLAATLVYRPGGGLETLALRSFVAALALHDALGGLVSPERLTLKWPNDVLLDGGKVAGILLESFGGADDLTLSVGIGVNLAMVPGQVEPDAVPPVSVVGAGGALVQPDDFLTSLAAAFARHDQTLTDFGFDPIRHLWLQNAARLGQFITARTGSETTSGIFQTIDAAGHLVLETGAGTRSIAAADVYF